MYNRKRDAGGTLGPSASKSRKEREAEPLSNANEPIQDDGRPASPYSLPPSRHPVDAVNASPRSSVSSREQEGRSGVGVGRGPVVNDTQRDASGPKDRFLVFRYRSRVAGEEGRFCMGPFPFSAGARALFLPRLLHRLVDSLLVLFLVFPVEVRGFDVRRGSGVWVVKQTGHMVSLGATRAGEGR